MRFQLAVLLAVVHLASSQVIINEINPDNPGPVNNAVYIELINTGNTPVALDRYKLILMNGDNNMVYNVIDLGGHTIPANGYFVVGTAGVSPTPDLIVAANDFFQKFFSAEAVGLYSTLPPFPTIDVPAQVIVAFRAEDIVVYLRGSTNAADFLLQLFTSGQKAVVYDMSFNSGGDISLSRCSGMDPLTLDQFTTTNLTPGRANDCPGDSVTCVDNPCDAQATCTDNAPGVPVTCTCGAGYEGDGLKNGTGCTDIDACAASPCHAQATCADKPAPALDATCTCNAGLTGDGLASGSGCSVFCPSGYRNHSGIGKCLRVHKQPRPYGAAKIFCRKNGGKLFLLDNSADATKLRGIMTRIRKTRGRKRGVWIGLTDQATEGTFLWEGGAALGAYTDWAPGAPGGNNAGRNCVQMKVRFGWKWVVSPCTKNNAFICEAVQP